MEKITESQKRILKGIIVGILAFSIAYGGYYSIMSPYSLTEEEKMGKCEELCHPFPVEDILVNKLTFSYRCLCYNPNSVKTPHIDINLSRYENTNR